MRTFDLLLALGIWLVGVTGCATTQYAGPPRVNPRARLESSTPTLLVDSRQTVTSGESEPWYVGRTHTIVGIPNPRYTRDNKPLASVFDAMSFAAMVPDHMLLRRLTFAATQG